MTFLIIPHQLSFLSTRCRPLRAAYGGASIGVGGNWFFPSQGSSSICVVHMCRITRGGGGFQFDSIASAQIVICIGLRERTGVAHPPITQCPASRSRAKSRGFSSCPTHAPSLVKTSLLALIVIAIFAEDSLRGKSVQILGALFTNSGSKFVTEVHDKEQEWKRARTRASVTSESGARPHISSVSL